MTERAPKTGSLSRRGVFALAAAGFVVPRLTAAAGRLGEDGLYHEDWFVETFLDLAEDIAAAAARGRRFAILWGLRGCPACKVMHETYFADAALVAGIRAHFDILHLNILGAREVTDVDGTRLGEKTFAQRYGIRGTPSIQFFPPRAEGLAELEPRRREVARMPGLLEPAAFAGLFRYVREEAYLSRAFPDWLAESTRARS